MHTLWCPDGSRDLKAATTSDPKGCIQILGEGTKVLRDTHGGQGNPQYRTSRLIGNIGT